MERDTIIYRGKKFTRYPSANQRQRRVYYWNHTSGYLPISLHTQIWIDNYGEIPKGLEVHHKDGNPLNNRLSNFELLTRGEHVKRHFNGELREKVLENLELARVGAVEWHKSPEAREFHSRIGKDSWKNKATYDLVCEVCEKPYQTYFPNRSKYCSRKCKAKKQNERRRLQS